MYGERVEGESPGSCCQPAPGGEACTGERPPLPAACPACGGRLKEVAAAHVLHHLRRPREREVAGRYGFCPAAGCPLVYAGADGRRFAVSDLRQPPAYKTGNPADLLCYCFDVDGREVLSPAGDAAVAFISERVRAGDCACDVLNPSAGCCLGSIGAYRKAAGAGPGPSAP